MTTSRLIAEVGGAIGLTPGNVDVVVYNRTNTALAAGDMVLFAFAGSGQITNDSLTINTEMGSNASIFGNVVYMGAGSTIGFGNDRDRAATPVGVMLEAAADGGLGKCRIRGVASAKVFNGANTAIVPGSHLTAGFTSTSAVQKIGYFEAANTSTTASFSADCGRVLGVCLEGIADPTSDGGTIRVFFDGINGMGVQN